MYYQRGILTYAFKVFVACSVFVLFFLIYKRSGWRKSLSWYDVVHHSLDDKRLNIAVVEEHHEVLQYWFTSAHKGLISAVGNVLIHIDAHSDAATPASDPKLSKFGFPKTAEQIQLLMQRNDLFIIAAAYKGFISTVIWVYPDWRDVNATKEIKITLGFYDGVVNGKISAGFCACYAGIVEEMSISVCEFTDHTGAQVKNYKAEDCRHYKNISMHVIKTSLASKLIPDLLQKSPSDMVLDIDEDFYGVMQGSDLLKGVDFDLIYAFNDLLSKIFTILSITDESNANTLLLDILRLVKVTCTPTVGNKRECSSKHFQNIQHLLAESGVGRIPIGNRKLPREALSQLVTFISKNFSAQNIDQLSKVGFCLTLSPQSHKLEADGSEQMDYERISVCHGINTPDMDNQIMVPNATELDKTTNALVSILELVPTKAVKLVTVARSNRDGFTPRHLQQTIEKKILESLKHKFMNSKVIYDPNLMVHLGQGIGNAKL